MGELQNQGTARERRPFSRWRRVGIALAVGWIVIVTIFLSLQAAAYAGLPSIVAEWEFDRFGESFPTINYVLLVALFSSPALLLLPRRRRRANVASPGRDLGRLAASGRGVLRLLLALIAGLTLATLALLFEIAELPGAQGQPHRIDVAAADTAILPEGPTILAGHFRADRTAQFDQNLLLARRSYRFVPMQPSSSAAPTLRFFVASDDLRNSPKLTAEPAGILRRASLPGEVVRLYRDAGYVVAPGHYVLYPDRVAMYWPLLATLAQLMLALLVLGIAAYLIKRHLTRMRDTLLVV